MVKGVLTPAAINMAMSMYRFPQGVLDMTQRLIEYGFARTAEGKKMIERTVNDFGNKLFAPRAIGSGSSSSKSKMSYSPSILSNRYRRVKRRYSGPYKRYTKSRRVGY